MRKIIHLDMDAFFASVEQRDNPAYHGKPLVVGGNPNGRGVVAAASYEIRAFGVHSAMSCYEARKRCPHAIFVRPRFEVYRAISAQIRDIMERLTPLVEPLSLDEAYLDVTDQSYCGGSATLMANWLRQTIYKETSLTASAGVSFNKMLAKIASDINKPNGITIITPDMAEEFLAQLPIRKFFGIGKASAARLHELGVNTGGELRALPLETLVALFGNKRGQFYHDIAHGRDMRTVKPERVCKSIGTEITFLQNSNDNDFILAQIFTESGEAFDDLTQRQLKAHTVTLKIKYSDFTQITRSISTKTTFKNHNEVKPCLQELFQHIPRHLPIRLVGVTFSNFQTLNESMEQLDLFAGI